jgi:hypothetical protein
VVEPWSSEADVKVAALHQESQNAPDWLPSTLRVRMEGKAVRRVREDRKFSLLRCAIEPWQRRTRQECASPRKSRALLTEPLLPQKPPLAKQRGKKKRKAKSSLTSAGLLMEGRPEGRRYAGTRLDRICLTRAKISPPFRAGSERGYNCTNLHTAAPPVRFPQSPLTTSQA